MTSNPKQGGPGGIAVQMVPLAVITVGGLFIIGGLDLGKPAGQFPLMLGAVTAALGVLEIVGNVFFSKNAPREVSKAPLLDRSEFGAVGWIFGTIALIYLIGILPGSFISAFVFTRIIERRRTMTSAAISASIVFVMWLTFSYLAKFDMYAGAFF